MGDVRQLKAFISATTFLTFGERIEYSPSNTAPNRLLGGTFSDKCRTISEISRINIGVGTGDFFPTGPPEIKDISERIIRKKRQYTGVLIKLRNQDISNAFNRAPLHPDCVAISCHQFASQPSGLEQDATVGWLSLSFGFSASPAIFAMCADAIQRAHHSGRALGGPWSGWGNSGRLFSRATRFLREQTLGTFSKKRLVRGKWIAGDYLDLTVLT